VSAVTERPDADKLFGVYIHWPFCAQKCPYCDFNSHVRFGGWDEARFLNAYLRELDEVKARVGGQTVYSIFFGGGTPSLMAPATAAALIDAIARLGRLAGDAEITLEANPTSTEAARLADFRAAGINRVSLGVQALDDHALASLGRRHSAAEAIAAVGLAARLMPRFSFDLIYARPNQTTAAWDGELRRAIALAGDHLSLYQLTIEPGTAFHRRRIAAADEETGALLFELTRHRLAAAGLPAYEISNHARPGGACRHNLHVWRGGAYLGLGPGAHGRLRPGDAGGAWLATAGIADPAGWLAAIEAGGDGLATRDPVSAEERAEELLMLGLRLADGIDAGRFRRTCGLQLQDVVDAGRVADLAALGLVVREAHGLRVTAAGRLCLDRILAELLAVDRG
jgi:oxygen-independent coproporphyrinogen-3 oxidase